MRVSRWGNSLAVRLPSSLVDALDLKEGDEVDLEIAGRAAWGVDKRFSRDEALALLKSFRGDVPADFRFDRDEANAR